MKLLLLTIIILAQNSHARLWGNDGGGGSSLAAEFVYVGRNALEILKYEKPHLGIGNTNEILEHTEVFAVNEICISQEIDSEQFCLDAQYEPEKQRIIFDKNQWKKHSCIDKFIITSHEYLRVAGHEDANYIHSSIFFGRQLSQKARHDMKQICNELIILNGKRELELERAHDRARGNP